MCRFLFFLLLFFATIENFYANYVAPLIRHDSVFGNKFRNPQTIALRVHYVVFRSDVVENSNFEATLNHVARDMAMLFWNTRHLADIGYNFDLKIQNITMIDKQKKDYDLLQLYNMCEFVQKNDKRSNFFIFGIYKHTDNNTENSVLGRADTRNCFAYKLQKSKMTTDECGQIAMHELLHCLGIHEHVKHYIGTSYDNDLTNTMQPFSSPHFCTRDLEPDKIREETILKSKRSVMNSLEYFPEVDFTQSSFSPEAARKFDKEANSPPSFSSAMTPYQRQAAAKIAALFNKMPFSNQFVQGTNFFSNLKRDFERRDIEPCKPGPWANYYSSSYNKLPYYVVRRARESGCRNIFAHQKNILHTYSIKINTNVKPSPLQYDSTCKTKTGCMFYCEANLTRIIVADGTPCIVKGQFNALDGVCVDNGTCLIMDNLLALNSSHLQRSYLPITNTTNFLKEAKKNLIMACQHKVSGDSKNHLRTLHNIMNSKHYGAWYRAPQFFELLNKNIIVGHGPIACLELVKYLQQLDLVLWTLPNVDIKTTFGKYRNTNACALSLNGQEDSWPLNSYMCNKYAFDYNLLKESLDPDFQTF